MKRVLPVVPDVRDEKDFKYASLRLRDQRSLLHRVKAQFVPEVVDLEPFCGPVKDQGDLGCCTGFTYAGYREFMLRRYFNYELPTKEAILAPLYVYYRERQFENTVNEDSGAQMRTGCQVLSQWGVCTEQHDPYRPQEFTKSPDGEDDEEAAKLKLTAYHRLDNIDEWKDCLRKGHPIAIGMAVFNSFFGVGSDGMMPMPKTNEAMVGGHAILVIGFDEGKKVFKVRNSWGLGWGDHGNFYMPYEFASNPEYVFDAWMLTLEVEANN